MAGLKHLGSFAAEKADAFVQYFMAQVTKKSSYELLFDGGLPLRSPPISPILENCD